MIPNQLQISQDASIIEGEKGYYLIQSALVSYVVTINDAVECIWKSEDAVALSNCEPLFLNYKKNDIEYFQIKQQKPQQLVKYKM